MAEPQEAARARVIATAAGVLAAGLAAYLGYAALADARPPGCGAGGGCAAVLTSRWSRVLGVPIALPATLTYAALAAGVWLKPGPARTLGLAAAAAATLAAAAWFIGVQRLAVGQWCVYCMATHAAASVAAFAAIAVLTHRQPGVRPGRKPMAAGVAAGLAAVVLTAVAQTALPGREAGALRRTAATTAADTTPDGPPEADAAQGGPDATAFNGAVAYSTDSDPIVGDPAGRLVLAMLDYNCPHCRDAHDLMLSRGGLRILALPVPLNAACNPHVPDTLPDRFRDSCEVNAAALAGWRLAPERFAELDRRLFKQQERAPGSTRELPEATADASAWAEARLKRNIASFGNLKALDEADRLPVILEPGNDRVLVGRIFAEDLDWLLGEEP